MPGQLHRVGIAIINAAAFRRAEKLGQRIMDDEAAYFVEEGRVADGGSPIAS